LCEARLIANFSKFRIRASGQDDLIHRRSIVYDHIGLKVKDIEASVRFYSSALASLGHVLCSRDETGAGLGPKGEPALWLYLDKQSPRSAAHVAFRAPDRAAVDRFHRDGLAAGGSDHGKPALRADYGPTYYAAFLIDPDGNNFEAVCMR
jgi:catechol 2,3-dioxygenase-like lactoylglutathione lyase family enzyme